MTDHSALTALLRRQQDDEAAAAAVWSLVYDDLRAVAARAMRRERSNHTLQPTALVHEAYVRLLGADADWTDRAHFLGVAARVMRQILVDHARRKNADKRGGAAHAVTFDEGLLSSDNAAVQLVELNQALDRFAQVDPRAAQVAELRLFGGMSVKEVAHVLQVSKRTIDGDWAMAKLWLAKATAPPT